MGLSPGGAEQMPAASLGGHPVWRRNGPAGVAVGVFPVDVFEADAAENGRPRKNLVRYRTDQPVLRFPDLDGNVKM